MASNKADSVSKYNFTAEPDSSLQCVICLEVAEDPRQHEKCGRLFCKECLEKYGRDKPCPNCRRKRPLYFEDNRGKREIKALCIMCSNMERGCEWAGTVGMLEEHVATCGFTLVPCPKQCKDDSNAVKHFMRNALDQHLKNDCPNRDYKCKSKCGEKGTYAYITEVHDKTCKMKRLPCPNAGCTKTLQRQHVSEHVSKCPHTVIPCKYKGIGCGTELKKKDMAAHEQDDKLHLHVALESVRVLQETTASQQTAIDHLSQGKIFVLSEYQKKKEANEEFQFPPFYTHPNGYHMALRVDANGYNDGEGTHVSVFAPIVEGEYDAELKWPFIGKITFTLLNQLEDKNHEIGITSLDATHNALVNDTWGRSTLISHSALAHDPVKNTQYLKDDKLYFRMTVEVADHKPWLMS